MTRTTKQIVEDITAHIRKRGGQADDWYVGISADARKALFGDHKVREKGDRWIGRRAKSALVAREARQHLIKTLAIDSGATTDESADMVYAYRKAPHTRP